jgi:hypothetical protein
VAMAQIYHESEVRLFFRTIDFMHMAVINREILERYAFGLMICLEPHVLLSVKNS